MSLEGSLVDRAEQRLVGLAVQIRGTLMIGLTRLRGGALSPIRNQRTSVEVVSSVETRVFGLIIWGSGVIGSRLRLKI